MSAGITLTPASGSITAGSTVVRVNITGLAANDTAAYDDTVYPTEPELTYYLFFDAPAGTDSKRSYVFAPNPDGTHEFNSFMFDKDGSWTVRLRKTSDDSDVVTSSVTVA